jgi:hypothetical protein
MQVIPRLSGGYYTNPRILLRVQSGPLDAVIGAEAFPPLASRLEDWLESMIVPWLVKLWPEESLPDVTTILSEMTITVTAEGYLLGKFHSWDIFEGFCWTSLHARNLHGKYDHQQTEN